MKMAKYAGKLSLALFSALLASAVYGQVNERTMRISLAGAPGHPLVLGSEKFAELLEEKSGGKIKLKIYANGVLGGDMQALSAVKGGTLDFVALSTGNMQKETREVAIVDFPFVFNDEKEANAILDGTIGKFLSEKLLANGLVNLAYWDLGFRNLTNNTRAINKAEDIVGLKIRVIQSPIYLETFKAMGANPVPMPFTEVYTALEQRIIDGQENPLSVIETSKLMEVQKYLTITNHINNPGSLVMSKKVWDRLTKDEQNIIRTAAIESQPYQRNISKELAAKAIEDMKKLHKKMEVTVLSPEEVAKIREKLKPVIEKFSTSVGPELVKQLQSELEKQRK